MHSRDNPSKDYVDLLAEYKELHKDPKYFNGICLITHLNTVGNIMLEEGAKSLLDYGCGKGVQYSKHKLHEEWNINLPELYDPYVEQYKKLPSYSNKYFDLVLCVDVMEHILPDEVDEVLHQIFFLGNFVYFHIDTKPALKKFSCGTNFHVSLHEPDWWINKLNEYGTNYHADFE